MGRRQAISNDQRRRLFAAGRRRGLDIDGLRAITPKGSISALTANQAEDLLCSLEGVAVTRRRFRGPRPTAGQLGFVRELLQSNGLTEGWLRRFGVDSISEVATSEQARKIIGALRAIQVRTLTHDLTCLGESGGSQVRCARTAKGG